MTPPLNAAVAERLNDTRDRIGREQERRRAEAIRRELGQIRLSAPWSAASVIPADADRESPVGPERKPASSGNHSQPTTAPLMDPRTRRGHETPRALGRSAHPAAAQEGQRGAGRQEVLSFG